MQIIQSIRDKGATIIIVVIALSLIGFILMDAKQGGNNLFSSISNHVGKVNGETIDLAEFNKRIRIAEDMQGQRATGIEMYRLRDNIWNQIIIENVIIGEAEKLGLDFTSKELSHILLSNDPLNPLTKDRSLLDSITGKLDVKKAQQVLIDIKKSKGEQLERVNASITELKLNTIANKYSGLINASAYYPTWMQEKETNENKNFANISYVTIPYSDISDSTIKVTDEDVTAYVNKNKELFKQEEEGRAISYISFSQQPSKEDSLAALEQLNQLKAPFQADTNAKIFVARNLSSIDFKDEFLPKDKLGSTKADSILAQSAGTVYGPYVDNGNYILAKLIGTKQQPDSAKARHILIPVNDQTSNGDETAKKLADSLYDAIVKGADFAGLAKTYSTDPGSKDNGGDLGTFAYGTMVPEFNEFCFTKTPGSKGVVKTQFGYHIIDLLGQSNIKPAYKVAFLGREIVASDVTINKASLDATKASSEKTKEALEKYAEKNKLSITPGIGLIKQNDYSVGALQDARSLVRWAYEAKKGEVSEPFNIGDQFVVATLDRIVPKGLQDAATAKSGSEAMIRKKKKAEIISKKLGSNPSLESAAAAYNKQVQIAGADSSITFNSSIINGIGMEPKIIGASFNKAYQNKVSPVIEGTTGVFVMKVNSIQPKAAETPEALQQRVSSRSTALRNQTGSWFEALRKQADIKDERSKHF